MEIIDLLVEEGMAKIILRNIIFRNDNNYFDVGKGEKYNNVK